MSDTIKKHVKDPGSAITHFIGMLMAVFAAVPLIIKATKSYLRCLYCNLRSKPYFIICSKYDLSYLRPVRKG